MYNFSRNQALRCVFCRYETGSATFIHTAFIPLPSINDQSTKAKLFPTKQKPVYFMYPTDHCNQSTKPKLFMFIICFRNDPIGLLLVVDIYLIIYESPARFHGQRRDIIQIIYDTVPINLQSTFVGSLKIEEFWIRKSNRE